MSDYEVHPATVTEEEGYGYHVFKVKHAPIRLEKGDYYIVHPNDGAVFVVRNTEESDDD